MTAHITERGQGQEIEIKEGKQRKTGLDQDHLIEKNTQGQGLMIDTGTHILDPDHQLETEGQGHTIKGEDQDLNLMKDTEIQMGNCMGTKTLFSLHGDIGQGRLCVNPHLEGKCTAMTTGRLLRDSTEKKGADPNPFMGTVEWAATTGVTMVCCQTFLTGR